MVAAVNNAPAISVVIPLFNKAAYVAETIRSVLTQDLDAHEIIVVDDGSTDGGAAIVEAMTTPKLKLVSQANSGVSVARNRGIDEASGDYIAFLDADDRYQPGYLAGIAGLISEFPEAGVYCSAYTSFRDDGTRPVRRMKSAKPGSTMLVDNFYMAWSNAAFTCTNAIVVRRSLLDDPGLRFVPGQTLGEDHDLWLRLVERTPMAYLDAALVDYRKGVAGSATQSGLVLTILPCYQRLHDRLASGAIPSHLRRGARRLLASHLLNIARTHMGLGNLGQATTFVADRRAMANPAYFVRTLLALAGMGMRGRPRA